MLIIFFYYQFEELCIKKEQARKQKHDEDMARLHESLKKKEESEVKREENEKEKK